MKSREPRRSVMISARLRADSGWNDARILNISSRGLLLQSPEAPRRGSYVEICRGPYRIVARVIWAQDERFGVCSQDRLPIESLATGAGTAEPLAGEQPLAERRSRPRPAPTAESLSRSRERGRAMEFLCFAVLGAAAAALAFDTVYSLLSAPAGIVSAKLARNS